jgi:hypothetical protein
MGDVIDFGKTTTADLPVSKVLAAAETQGLESVIVIGIKPTGGTYFALSSSDAAMAVFLLEIAKAQIIEDQLTQ